MTRRRALEHGVMRTYVESASARRRPPSDHPKGFDPSRLARDEVEQLGLAVCDGGCDERREQRMGFGRPRRELRMRLGAHVERVDLPRELDDLDQIAIR